MPTSTKLPFRVLAMSVLLLCTVISVFAQNSTGAIKGLVKDQNNAVVTTAVATATSKATGAVRKMNAGGDGVFVFESLQPGDYEVKVEAPGFSTQVQVLAVQIGGTTTAEFAVAVGATTQTVDVTADAPVLNTTDTVVGGIIGRDRVENLPLNGRSFLSIAMLEPGVNVTYTATSGAGNPNSFFQVSIGGAPNSMTFITVDGARVNDRITGGTSQNFSAETVQEFQISTLGFDLSTGTVSAGAVNIVSRTGTNNLHGSAFLFYRDHNMSAFTGFKRPNEIQASGLPQNLLCLNPNSAGCKAALDPFFVRRQWGGTVGGPIKKDKLFFFANYERTSQVGANVVTFTDPLVFGYNHVAQQPLDGDLTNVRLDYTVNQKHTAFLRGNVDSNDSIAGTGLESRWITSSNYAYQTQMGLTSVLKSNLVNDFRFAYSYFRNRLRQPTLEECTRVSGDPDLCFGIDGPQINFFGGLSTGTNVNVSQDRHPRTFQITENVNWTKGSHRIRFGGNYELQNGHGSWNQNSHGTFSAVAPTTLAAVNPAIYNALPASVKTGYTGPRATFAELLQIPMTGSLSIGLGDAGQPAPYRYNEILTNHNIRFYGQDAWQVFKGFTLNYGLGWSYESQTFYTDLPDLPQYLAPLLGKDLRGPQKQYKNFDPALGFAWALGKDEKTVLRASVSLHHISGNVGFYILNQRILFGPAGNGLQPVTSTALQNPENAAACSPLVANSCLSFSSPFTNFTVGDMLNYLGTARGILQSGLPFKGDDLSVKGVELFKTVAGAQLLDAIYNSDSSRAPYTFQVDVGLQREVMRNVSVSADYVLRRGVGFGAGVSGFDQFFPDINRWNRFSGYAVSATSGVATPGPRNPIIPACTTAQSLLQRTDPRAFAAAQCSLGPIQYGLPGILSTYQALNFKVDKRFSHGFQIGGGYSLSRYWTLVSISSLDNFYDGHGISPNNPKHRFTGSAIWELPKYKGNFAIGRAILNNWQLSTVMDLRSGTPTSVTLPGTIDIEGDGTFTYRLPGTTVSSFGYKINADGIRQLVNQYNGTVAAPKDTPIAAIPAGAQRDAIGTVLPYIILPDKFSNSDSFLSHDLRVQRAIIIRENIKLNLIGEAFNIFNIANLTGYSGTLDAYIRPTATRNASTGAITITAPGRNPTFNFGQPTGRVSPIFGTGGPRAFQIAARLSF